MRFVWTGLAVMMVALPLGADPAGAQRQARPWCLLAGQDGPGGGLPDCSYQTLAQCRAAVGSGPDGCIENPALGWDRIQGKRAPAAPQGR